MPGRQQCEGIEKGVGGQASPLCLIVWQRCATPALPKLTLCVLSTTNTEELTWAWAVVESLSLFPLMATAPPVAGANSFHTPPIDLFSQIR